MIAEARSPVTCDRCGSVVSNVRAAYIDRPFGPIWCHRCVLHRVIEKVNRNFKRMLQRLAD